MARRMSKRTAERKFMTLEMISKMLNANVKRRRSYVADMRVLFDN